MKVNNKNKTKKMINNKSKKNIHTKMIVSNVNNLRDNK